MIAAALKTTGQYQPYPEYKNTGLTWLGAIPNHWGLKRAKFVFKRVQRPVRVEDDIVTAFRDGQVTLRSNRRTEGFTNALQEIGYQGVRSGDLLIHAMDGFAGAIGISDSEGKCSPVCSVCIPISAESVNPYYYGYLVRQLAVTGFITSLSKGIRERSTEFRFSEFSPLELALPPVDEQHIIAAFLDYETARIDRLIAQQHRLIELLKEKRQAVISHAVTKGLNPDVPMKDSGVEWLGQVPEHWGASRVGWCCQVGNGCTPSRDNGDYWSEGTYPWLNSGKVNDGYIVSAEQFVTAKALKECSLPKVPAGSIVMAITGEGKTRGSVAITAINTTLSQHLAYITVTNTNVSAGFLRIWLESQYQRIRFESEGWGSTKAAITCSDIKSYPLPEPPLDEQLKIVEYVGDKNHKFDLLIQRSELMITVLQERRTALISAAVTGKIDLRGWTPPTDSEVAA
jgi:type I restriction enzyme S subunit